MGGLAHYLEDEGIPTVGISLVRSHTEKMRPPRALAVPFELGRPFGMPNEPDFQRRVLRALLELFVRHDRPPVLEDFPDEPPGGDVDSEGWACPVSFAAPVEQLSDAELVERALVREIALLKPWYDEAVRAYRRSAFGISGKTPQDIAHVLAGYVTDPDAPPTRSPASAGSSASSAVSTISDISTSRRRRRGPTRGSATSPSTTGCGARPRSAGLSSPFATI